MSDRLWICWTRPKKLPSADEALLSFLMPSVEDELRREWRGRILSARNEADSGVRFAARRFYFDLLARLGLVKVPFAGGRTFRQCLATQDSASRWWYHPVTFKDCEASAIYNSIIAIFTIRKIAALLSVRNLILVGAPAEIAGVLESDYAVTFENRLPAGSTLLTALRGLAVRFAQAIRFARTWFAIRNTKKFSTVESDFVCAGFWNWSLRWNAETRSLSNPYFGSVPARLTDANNSVTWLIWFDEGQKHKNKRLNELVSACVSGHIRPLAAEIGFGDFVGIFLDFNPLALYLRVKGLEAFRKTFIHEKLDFWTLFEKPLLAGFLDASIVECELMALATERACRHYRPKAALHFMEHFPLARAHYKGVRRGAGKILNVAVQHASYNHEKTFLFLEPAIEFHGAPDGQPVPHPDKVCVMGSFAKQLFKDCGYADGDLFVTGSPRYDHLGPSEPIGSTRTESESLNLLILSSLGFTAEIDLLDAVCAAAKGLPRVLLSLRNHPLGRLDLDRRFARYSRQVRTTSGSLADDLALADIVLFTYSTAAEEAFLAGKPVWQWLPIGYDGSALAEVTDIPRFSSVGSLRDALIECRAKRNFRPPTTAAKITVLEQLFYSNDGAAAKRIAHVCKENTKELEFSGV